MKKQLIKCVVSCTNSNGEADLFFVKIKTTKENIEAGFHCEEAREIAAENGYEDHLCYDQNDYAFAKFSKTAVRWKTTSVFEIPDNKYSVSK